MKQKTEAKQAKRSRTSSNSRTSKSLKYFTENWRTSDDESTSLSLDNRLDIINDLMLDNLTAQPPNSNVNMFDFSMEEEFVEGFKNFDLNLNSFHFKEEPQIQDPFLDNTEAPKVTLNNFQNNYDYKTKRVFPKEAVKKPSKRGRKPKRENLNDSISYMSISNLTTMSSNSSLNSDLGVFFSLNHFRRKSSKYTCKPNNHKVKTSSSRKMPYSRIESLNPVPGLTKYEISNSSSMNSGFYCSNNSGSDIVLDQNTYYYNTELNFEFNEQDFNLNFEKL